MNKKIVGCKHNIKRKIEYPKVFKKTFIEGTRIFLVCPICMIEIPIILKNKDNEEE